MKQFKLIGILAFCLAAHSLHAQGILVVEQETRDGKTSSSQIQMDKTHVRAESRATGENNAFIFDSGSQVVRILNLDKKSYSEINQSQMQQIQRQMAEMAEQMKNLPPQQRAMMEQMMKGRGGMPGMPTPAAPIAYRASGSDKVGPWTCSKYDGFRGQEKVSEVCTVDPQELGLSPADFDAAKQLAEFFKSMMPQLADQALVYGTPAEQGFSGVPVRRTSFADGKVSSVTETKEFRRETFPASTWETPAGFTKEAGFGR